MSTPEVTQALALADRWIHDLTADNHYAMLLAAFSIQLLLVPTVVRASATTPNELRKVAFEDVRLLLREAEKNRSDFHKSGRAVHDAAFTTESPTTNP